MIGALAHEFRALELNDYWRFMFDTLNTKFEKIVQSIRGKAVISETDLEVTLREIRIALLEADVSLVVVKEFINSTLFLFSRVCINKENVLSVR